MAPARIVVVEDNDSDVYLLRRALDDQTEDYHLEVFRDGEQAIQFAGSRRAIPQDAEPCVILLDLHLPKCDGLEVLQAIKKEPVLSHVRVIVTTTAASPQQEAELRRLGAGYRVKPKDLDEFRELASDLIALCKGTSATDV